jgi:hypothetical protein
MRLHELFEDSTGEESVNLRITGVLSHILGRIEDTDTQSKMSVDSLIQKLADVGVSISPKELMDKYKEPPFSEFIANVSGNDVVFLSQNDTGGDAVAPDDSTGTLEKMAKRASKKRD